jgi:hypothetical protein
VLYEHDFEVELSNEGILPKGNPCPANPSKRKDFRCWASGCKETTSNKDGLCTAHKNAKPKLTRPHLVDWIGRVCPPKVDKEKCKNFAPEHSALLELLVLWMEKPPKDSLERIARQERMDKFVTATLSTFVGKVPDATTMERDWEKEGDDKGKMAEKVISDITDLVNEYFPKAEFANTLLSGRVFEKQIRQDTLAETTGGQEVLAELASDSTKSDGGKKIIRYEIPLLDVPIRIVAALALVGLACEESNRGDLWFAKTYRGGIGSARASIYMPIAYYLLRRYTDASDKQARMSLKTRVSD